MKNIDISKKIMKLTEGTNKFVFFKGNAIDVLKEMHENSVDCCITSPPYWNLREYNINTKDNGNTIGNEKTPEEYVINLTKIIKELKRVLKKRGSFWLNLGDKYHNKNLMGMPWRVALAIQSDGWILRNDVIWDQMKGTQSAKDRLRDSYEHLFHFVKEKKYYFDDKSIRIKPTAKATNKNGKIISATGVSGIKYKQQIENSTILSSEQKVAALAALNQTLGKLSDGTLVDFRMTIKGNQRAFHSDKTNVSGRAKELEKKGYYILTMKSSGFLPSDIWRIVPEDAWRKDAHYAVFPEELLSIPIKSTCPEGGVVLDPFCGTGSAVAAAINLKRKGVGIDLSKYYIGISKKRIRDIMKKRRQQDLFDSHFV